MYPKNRFKTGPNRETGHLKFQFQAVFWCGPKNVNLHFYVQKGFVVQAGGFLFFSPWKTKKKKRLALRARSLALISRYEKVIIRRDREPYREQSAVCRSKENYEAFSFMLYLVFG